MKKTLFILLVALGMTMTLSVSNSHADLTLSGLDHTVNVAGEPSVELEQCSSVMVTESSGNVLLVENQSSMPSNLDGSTIDIFDCCVRASGSSGVAFCVSADRGVITAVSGASEVTTNTGKAVKLKEGEEYNIHLDEGGAGSEEELAPPTAASGESLGSSIASFDPFDSTNPDDNRDNPVSPSGF